MLQKKELKRIFPILIFWAVYTLLFVLWARTFFYTLPFFLGLLIAVAVHPVIRILESRLRLSHTLITTLVTLTAVFAVLAAVTLLGVFIVREIAAFFMRLSEDGFEEFSRPVTDILTRASEYLSKFNLQLLKRNNEEILKVLQNSFDLIMGFLRTLLGLLTSLPTIAAMVIVTVFAAFFIARDLDKLEAWVKRMLSTGAISQIRSAKETSGGMGRKYMMAYLLLYLITFSEAAVILVILDLPYPLLTGFITATADVLPVFGPGLVFLPLAIYQLLTGGAIRAIGILIGWGVISLLRQIIEPKLISGAAKVHPLAVLAAVYFSLVGKNFWLLLYMMGFFTLFSIFRETGALPPILESSRKTPPAPPEQTAKDHSVR